jgi:uncharacterized protein YjbJ (UPF0337 family)
MAFPNCGGHGPRSNRELTMDKDRIAGAAKEIKGGVKDAAGKLTGDDKLQAEGKAEKAAGKAQNAFGKAKDAAREAADALRRP